MVVLAMPPLWTGGHARRRLLSVLADAGYEDF